MAFIIQQDPKDLKNLSDEIDLISPAPTPSGLPHLGTAMTYFYSMYVLAENPNAKLEVMIMDTDFHFQLPNPFIPYTHKKDNDGKNLVDVMREESIRILDEIGTYFGIEPSRYSVKVFSKDLLQDSNFTQIINSFMMSLEGRILLKQTLLPDPKVKATQLMSLTCPSCYTSSINPPTIHGDVSKTVSDVNDTGLLRAKCVNEDCPDFGNSYETDLRNPQGLNMHYMSTGFRFIHSKNLVDSNVYGPDYAFRRVGRKSKLERLSDFVEEARDILGLPINVTPIFYVGPLFTYQGDDLRHKISKSNGGISFSIQRIRTTYPNWVEIFGDLLLGKYGEQESIDVSEIYHFENCIKAK